MKPVTVRAATDAGFHCAKGHDGAWLAMRGATVLARRASLPLAFRSLRLAAETVELRASDMLRKMAD